EVIAEPTPKALEEFQRIYEKITKPKRALDVVGTNVIRVSKSDTIGKTLEIMNKQGFSQIPVVGHDGFVGMFTAVHLIEVLSNTSKESIDTLLDMRLDEILHHGDSTT
ncbi:hypothetical protein ADUPG1_004063, partial [Aduncisulcus paluster]